MTLFNLQRYDGAYAVYVASDPGPASWPHLLVATTTDPGSKPLSLADAWALTAPWALIVRTDAWDLTAETPATTAGLLNFSTLNGASVLAWRADPTLNAAWWSLPAPVREYQSLVLEPNGPNRQTRGSVVLGLGNITLTAPGGVQVSLDPNGAQLNLARVGSQFTIGRTDAAVRVSYDTAVLLTSPVDGMPAGSLKSSASGWKARSVFALGVDAPKVTGQSIDMPEIRYWAGADGAAAQRLRLPLFDPVDFSTPDLTVDFALNPALPFEPAATRFDISAATNACFTSTAALMTRDSQSIGLTPIQNIGFHLAPGQLNGKNAVYLAPYGQFSLTAPSSGSAFRLMPGLSGLEYIQAGAGDLLDLVPARPAFGAVAQAGANGASGDPPKLTADCTTAWMRLTPAGTPSRAYFAQPLASVFYASPDGAALPRAADAHVADLTGREAPYPLAPYANLFGSGAITVTPPPADVVTAFEHTYLSGIRGTILGSQVQPIFSIDGTVLTDKGATPRGLMAEIGPTPPAPSALAPSKSGARAASVAAAGDTPAGQWRRLYLAKGVQNVVTLEPGAGGVIDPVVGNALLQPDLFMVYNNWAGHAIGLAGELDVGGFSFDWTPLQSDPCWTPPNPCTVAPKPDPCMVVVAKFTTKVSLQDLFASPERWRDRETLVANGGDPVCAQNTFNAAMQTALAAQKAGSTLFDDFLNRIATSPSWTGFVAFQAPVDGNAMPPTLQILIAGMRAPLRAHHLAVDVTALASQGGVPKDVGPSSVAGVISYDDPGGVDPAGANGYGFYTQSLKVGIFGSAVTSFNAEVGIAAKTLFGREATLRPPADPTTKDPFPDTFLLKGVYHIVANVPTVTFQVPEARTFDFPIMPGLPDGGFARVLNRFEIDSASILPQPDDSGDNVTTHRAQVTLNGQLWFNPDPFNVGVDLFSYGVEAGAAPAAGLALNNFGLAMTFQLKPDGQSDGPPTLAVDYARLAVSETPAAKRAGALMTGLPLKLKGILANDAGLDVGKLGGKAVNVLQIAGKESKSPHFALQFELIIGSLGELSGVHAALTAEMRLAWGPRDATPDADGALLTIQLPGASAGFDQLNVQGMLKLTFGDANLLQVAYLGEDGKQTPTNVFAVLFNNVALSVMGISLPPKVVSDLVLFSDPRNPTGSNLAGCLAVHQT